MFKREIYYSSTATTREARRSKHSSVDKCTSENAKILLLKGFVQLTGIIESGFLKRNSTQLRGFTLEPLFKKQVKNFSGLRILFLALFRKLYSKLILSLA